MSSFLALSFFFSVCLCAQAQTGGSLREVTFASVVEVEDGYLLVAAYTSVGPVQVAWYRVNGTRHCLSPSDFEVGVYENGQATYMKVNKTEDLGSVKYYLSVGDLKAHYFEIEWNVPTNGTMSVHLNAAPSRIDPGTDLAYGENEKPEVTIAVREDDGTGDLVLTSTQLPVRGENYNKTTDQVDTDLDGSFVEVVVQSFRTT